MTNQTANITQLTEAQTVAQTAAAATATAVAAAQTAASQLSLEKILQANQANLGQLCDKLTAANLAFYKQSLPSAAAAPQPMKFLSLGECTMPDGKCCSICKGAWSFVPMRRPHHCRVCGCAACDKCAPIRSFSLSVCFPLPSSLPPAHLSLCLFYLLGSLHPSRSLLALLPSLSL